MDEIHSGVKCLVKLCRQPVFGVASAVNKFCPGHRIEYTQREWDQCPSCGDTRIIGDDLEPEYIWVYQTVHCTACDASWSETYTASGRTEYEEGDMR